MPESCRLTTGYHKINFFLFFFIIMSLSVYAQEECRGTSNTDDIPCMIFLSLNASVSGCGNVTMSIYNHSTFLYQQNMSTYNFFTCNATFNQTAIGTYNIFYSTGDTGSIVLEEGTKMILFLYFMMAVIALLIIYGVTQEDVVTTSIGAFGLTIYGIFVFVSGFNAIQNSITNWFSIAAIALGCFFLIPLMQWAVDELNAVSG